MARRVRRLFRGGRIIDLGGGHGLLAQLMLLLDDSSPTALVVDRTLPPRAARCTRSWSRPGRGCPDESHSSARGIEDIEILRTDVVVSSHACGQLTDLVLERAGAARARVAVLPCCHDLAACDTGALSGWVDGPVAVDILRAHASRAAGLSHLDAGHSCRDHPEEPPAAWRTRSWIARRNTSATAEASKIPGFSVNLRLASRCIFSVRPDTDRNPSVCSVTRWP